MMDKASKLVAVVGGDSQSVTSSEDALLRRDELDLDPAIEPNPETTEERTLDRWFRERHGSPPLRRLRTPNEALITNAGPLKLSGNLTLIEEDLTVSHHNELTLCRCGSSNHRPYCDDRHLDIEFFNNGSMQAASEVPVVHRPQRVTLRCIKDGPLQFKGYLRLYNRKGQEFTALSGNLCRCGDSTKKPFCDCV